MALSSRRLLRRPTPRAYNGQVCSQDCERDYEQHDPAEFQGGRVVPNCHQADEDRRIQSKRLRPPKRRVRPDDFSSHQAPQSVSASAAPGGSLYVHTPRLADFDEFDESARQ